METSTTFIPHVSLLFGSTQVKKQLTQQQVNIGHDEHVLINIHDISMFT